MWKTNFFFFHKQYLFGLLFSRNPKEAGTNQSVLQTFLLCLKRNVPQIFKSSSCIKVFLKCVCHWYNLLWQMFFISCDNWKLLFFIQIYCYPEVQYNHHVAPLFETSVFKEICIYICYLSITKLLIANVQNKASTS